MKRLAFLLPALAGLLPLGGCASSGEPDIATLASSSDQIIWEAAEKAASKKQWDNARQHYRRIIDAFPNSEHGPAARLGLADSYFEEGGTANYILAVSSYREFLTLFPSHPRSDYAQFRVGESFWRQRNGPDRDQTATLEALHEFERLVERHPKSTHIEEGRQRLQACRQSLARAEFMVGYFYQRTRTYCRAAISRYEGVLSEYPDYSGLDEVLFRLAECLSSENRIPEALPHLSRLIEQFPNSEFASSAKELMT
ncbi:MAG TPA: outer membrane protein assembly factor BamD, partial [Vicinamibacteria bacterium]